MTRTHGVSLIAAILLPALQCMAQAPRMLYSDLESGPALGGENNQGVFVTLYGKRFGAAQANSFVTLGGVRAVAYKVWSDSKVTFQPGGAAASGPITLTTSYGQSNSLPFTVRPGAIYFVAISGSDDATGASGSPWQTIPHARNMMQPGDTVYVQDGVSQSADDGEGWDAALTLRNQWCGGGYPRGLIAYPGANATIGSYAPGSPSSGLRVTDFSAAGGACAGNWVFAGLNFRGISPVAVNGPSQNWRFVANDVSCPTALGDQGGGACFLASLASNISMYGNTVHDAGAVGASALFQGVYFSTDSNHIDMGWNTVARVKGCRGVQVHSSPLGSGYPNSGFPQHDLTIHDNIVHDTQCDGIIIDTVDPSNGTISVFNNLIYNAGTGPANPEQSGAWSCLNFPGSVESGAAGTGTIEIFNNTFVNCGQFTTPPYQAANAGIIAGGGNPGQFLHLRDNLFSMGSSSLWMTGIPYLVQWNPSTGRMCGATDPCQWVFGSGNLFFGSGTTLPAPALQGSNFGDPQFLDTAGGNFHISMLSPAYKSGVPTPQVVDLDGMAALPVPSIGAFSSPGIVYPPQLSVTVLQHFEIKPGVEAVDLQFVNSGQGVASAVQFSDLQVSRLSGSGIVAVDSGSASLPLRLPVLPPGSSTTQRVLLDIPVSATRFRITESGYAVDAQGGKLQFSLAQAVIR